MKRAIHVDRFNLCHEGAVLYPDEHGWGPHGRAMNRPFKCPYEQSHTSEDIHLFNEAVIEHVFELVRQAKFSSRPSRFKCWYGSNDMSWVSCEGFSNYPVWLVEAEDFFQADANLLDIFSFSCNTRFFNPDMALQNATYYWEGKTLRDLLYDTGEKPSNPSMIIPHYELLLVPPVRVIRQLSC